VVSTELKMLVDPIVVRNWSSAHFALYVYESGARLRHRNAHIRSEAVRPVRALSPFSHGGQCRMQACYYISRIYRAIVAAGNLHSQALVTGRHEHRVSCASRYTGATLPKDITASSPIVITFSSDNVMSNSTGFALHFSTGNNADHFKP